jgi:alpha-galactosidase
MKKLICAAMFLGLCCLAVGAHAVDLKAKKAPKNGVWLDSLDFSALTKGSKRPAKDKPATGVPLTLGRAEYAHGLGTQAVSELLVDLRGCATRFDAVVGVDDGTQATGAVVFEVWADNCRVAETGNMRSGDKPKRVSADLTGARYLLLLVLDGGDGTRFVRANWAGALLTLAPDAKEAPAVVAVAEEAAPSIIHTDPPEPRIHGPRVTGATPGRPFLFLIPATGEGPLSFAAKGLPEGLALDANTGIISGALKQAGETEVALTVSGPKGSDAGKLTIVGGENKLAQTPPMGWNSWNVWARAVDDAKVRAAADAMVSSGLAAHGFQYINIDDAWEGARAANGEILPNEKFPDMKALADYVHSKGLRFGIYSSPGPLTCADYTGSYEHEQQDANTYAAWGVDYLKYDLCSYRDIARVAELDVLKKPYFVMREALDRCGRDIVYSLCQYGRGDVWQWGEEVGGNLWRTTGDIGDTWKSVSTIGFAQTGKEAFAGPGHWNDPDMLVVGKVGWGPSIAPTKLTPNEQLTHITLWCMLAAPLLIGCDLEQMDDFTRALLTNGEVLDIDQDPLGSAGARRAQDGLSEIWTRPLHDGTTAVALFNRAPLKRPVTVKWADVGLQGRQPVRDLWQWKDMPPTEEALTIEVPGHGAVLLKVGAASAELRKP